MLDEAAIQDDTRAMIAEFGELLTPLAAGVPGTPFAANFVMAPPDTEPSMAGETTKLTARFTAMAADCPALPRRTQLIRNGDNSRWTVTDSDVEHGILTATLHADRVSRVGKV